MMPIDTSYSIAMKFKFTSGSTITICPPMYLSTNPKIRDMLTYNLLTFVVSMIKVLIQTLTKGSGPRPKLKVKNLVNGLKLVPRMMMCHYNLKNFLEVLILLQRGIQVMSLMDIGSILGNEIQIAKLKILA